MFNRREFVCAAAALVTVGSAIDPRNVLAEGETMPDSTQLTAMLIPADRPIRIGAVAFPRMDQVDLTGPYAVLSRLPNSSFQVLWKNTSPIKDYHGLGLVPDAAFADAGILDLLMVCGGPGQEGVMEDEEVLSFIRKQATTAKCVFSVCTGALICGAAGLLKGRSATTHWQSVSFLTYFGAKAVDKRVVIDGNFVSAAGLTAGIDGALTVAALLRGESAAKAIQLDIQYAPEPPYDCGLPQKAPVAIVEQVKRAGQQLREQRLVTAKRIAAKFGVAVEG